METIKIAHLYYDLMNLYGEHGNVRALTHFFEEHKVRAIVHNLSIEDSISFQDYDLFYIGSGSKESFQLVLEDIVKYKKEIKQAMKEGKFFLITGNAIDLFGQCFIPLHEQAIPALKIFDYQSEEIDFRIVGEQVVHFAGLKEEIIGFENRDTILTNVKEKPLFLVQNGTGYTPKDPNEGIMKNNFYGTYLLGPLFIRNPYFTEKIVAKILKAKQIPYHAYRDEIAIKAYHEYQKNLLHEEELPN